MIRCRRRRRAASSTWLPLLRAGLHSIKPMLAVRGGGIRLEASLGSELRWALNFYHWAIMELAFLGLIQTWAYRLSCETGLYVQVEVEER